MNKNPKTAFITGANRGIGLGLSRHMAERGYIVFAGYRERERSAALFAVADANDAIRPVQVDVTHENDLERVRNTIDDAAGALDVLVNNAGVNVGWRTPLNDVPWDEVERTLRVNLGGPFLATKILYPLIVKGREKKVINLSSGMASIERSGSDAIAYRASKAALNMLSKVQAEAYRHDGVIAVALSPGWVKTEMGGKSAPLSVEESASKILNVIKRLGPADSGRFLSENGQELPY